MATHSHSGLINKTERPQVGQRVLGAQQRYIVRKGTGRIGITPVTGSFAVAVSIHINLENSKTASGKLYSHIIEVSPAIGETGVDNHGRYLINKVACLIGFQR